MFHEIPLTTLSSQWCITKFKAIIPELRNDANNLLLLLVFCCLVRLFIAHVRRFDYHYLHI